HSGGVGPAQAVLEGLDGEDSDSGASDDGQQVQVQR
ncbi:hypothetical protein A2U01_0091923, partial [Trifolium medium]|nr:hypothetical protein [Trifolium medium]